MFGENFAKELQSIPLSNDTVFHRIDDIAEDVEQQLFGKLRDKLFSIQLDEATDSNKDAHFIAYVRFWDEIWILKTVLLITSKTGVIIRDSLRRNNPFSQMVSFNLTVGAVEPHHLSQCLDPTDDLGGVFLHPELPVHVKKQTELPAYLKQLVLERIGEISIDVIQVYTDGSRDDYYRSGSGIFFKS
ncbi:uncharacterized protein TNCV_4030211 [Trichonephila clavipes]|nr:uncharacterized protein TNCV_4030211 [Trichonephila clavipes]